MILNATWAYRNVEVAAADSVHNLIKKRCCEYQLPTPPARVLNWVDGYGSTNPLVIPHGRANQESSLP